MDLKSRKNTDHTRAAEQPSKTYKEDLKLHSDNSARQRNSRTDPTPAITGEYLTPEYSSLKKSFKCDICHIDIQGITSFEKHLSGNKHKKQLIQLSLMKKYKNSESLGFLECGTISRPESDECKLNKDQVTKVCNDCCLTFSSVGSFEEHLVSDYHNAQTQRAKLFKNAKQEMCAKSDDLKLDKTERDGRDHAEHPAQYNTCNKSFRGPQALREHLSSNVHKVQCFKQSEKTKEMNSTIAKDDAQTKMCSKEREHLDPFTPCCKLCSKNFTGKIPYIQHVSSAGHLKKLKNAKLAIKLKSTLQCDEDGFFLEKDMSNCFPDEKQQTCSPSKRKCTVEKLLKVQNHFPELRMERITGSGVSLNTRSDTLNENVFLVCSLCQQSLSSPESAVEHCVSEEHLSAKKRRDTGM